MKLHRNESGQMLIMTALELVLLFGFLALATDVGVLFHSKRHMQIAVDAAATAAALNNYNASGGYNGLTGLSDTAVACNAIADNGYATAADCATASGSTFSGSNGVQVTIKEPPTDGYHQGMPGFVEVVMNKPDPLYFFKVFTGNNTATVAARAVAGDPEGAAGCIYTNNMYLGGSGTIQGSTSASKTSCSTQAQKACGIYVNGTATSLDNGSVVCADFVEALSGSGTQFTTEPTPTQIVNSSPQQPYQYAYAPDPLGADLAMCTAGTGGAYGTTGTGGYNGNIYPLSTILPDTANNGLPIGLPKPISYSYTQIINGVSVSETIDNVYCFTQNVTIGSNGSTTNFPPGFYVFENGATLTGQVDFGTVNYTATSAGSCDNSGTVGLGAVVYNYSGTFALSGSQTQIAACAPTNMKNAEGQPNEYNGLAIFQPYPLPTPTVLSNNTNTLALVFGNSSLQSGSCSITDAALNGWIVAPGAAVTLQDQGGGLTVTGIVSGSIGVPNQKVGGTGGNGSFNGTMSVCNYNTVNSNTTPFKVINLVE